MAEVEVEERAASPLPGEVGYAERVRAALDASPKPSTPQEYNLTEAAFWRHRHVPAGSVIEFTSLGEDGASPEGLVALQVLSMESDLDGIWLEVRVLGAEHDEVKKDMQKYFKSNRRQVHLCEHTSTGQCKLAAEPGWHLTEFKWYPAGDYVAPFLSAHARKKVKEGPRMEMEATGRSGRKSAAADNGAPAPPSLTEKRLDALRGASRRVTFGDLGAPAPSSLPPAGGPDGRRAGILRKPGGGRICCAGTLPGERGQGEDGDHRPDLQSGPLGVSLSAEEAQERGRCAGQSGRDATAGGREEGEEQERQEEKEEAPQEEEEQRRGGHRLQLIQREQLTAAASQEAFAEGARFSSTAPGGSSLRVLGQGRRCGRFGRRCRARATPKAGHLLPVGLAPGHGPARKGLKRACPSVPLLRPPEGRKVGRVSRPAGREAHCSGNGDTPGLAGGAAPGDSDQRGGGHGPGPHLAGSSAPWQASGESRGEGQLEPGYDLGERVARRPTAKGKRKGSEGKRKERQGKRKRRQKLGPMGSTRRCRRGQEDHGGGAVIGPLPMALADSAEGEQAVDGGRISAEAVCGASSEDCRAGSMQPCADLDGNSDCTFTATAVAEEISPQAMADRNSNRTLTEAVAAEVNLPQAAADYEGWLFNLGQVDNLKQFGILLAWGVREGFSLLSLPSAGPQQLAGRKAHSGELFPLPVIWPSDFSRTWRDNYASCSLDFSVECWVACTAIALNDLYGCSAHLTERRPGKVHAAALGNLRDKVKRFLLGEGSRDFSFEQVVADLKEKRVSYTGEEVSRPICLTAEQIQQSLPPRGHGGSIPVTRFLRGRTKHLMENPLESLLPLRERNTGPMQAKVHIEKGAEMAVFELLDERGVITWLPESEVFRDETGECLNGLFGVVKQGKTTPAGRPVLRVIMNLVPANRLFEVIHGDVQLLPNGTSWIPLVVSEGEELRVSQGDMAAAFYLYSVPATWYPYFAFNYRVQGERIRRTAGQFYRPCCRVLPMGWNSSVGIMQQLSREILLTQGLPGELELHKGTPAPVWFTRTIAEASEARAWWQVYLDNFMSAECSEGTYEGLDASLQGKAMSAWHATGVLTADDKQVISAATAVELGIRLDGRLGLLGASPERLFKTALATVHVLQKHGGSVKDAQIILGRWVFILQFRRAAMAVLSHSWEAIETPWASKSKVNLMLKELQMLLCLGPVIQTDMRCEYDDMVTCSDASETGGAAARSAGLSWSGHSLTNALQNRGRQPILCPILVVSLFNGVGGAFRIYDILGVRPLERSPWKSQGGVTSD